MLPSLISQFTATIERLPNSVRSMVCYALVLAIAVCVFFVNRAEPPHLFWDENYHVTSAQRYIEGVAHLEPHPPLGLMLIAAGEALYGANEHVNKHVLVRDKKINGSDLPAGFSFGGMRLMPSLFAAFGALMFYGLMYAITQHRLQALLLSSLYLFENAFVVHFRATHLDSFQMFFSIAALWQFVYLWKRQTPLSAWNYAALGALCALALMIKVNAVFLYALFVVLYFKDAKTHNPIYSPVWALDFARKSGAAIAASVLVVFVTFYLHASLGHTLPDRGTSAGRQDLANMSPQYQAYVKEHSVLTPGLVAIVIRDYFAFMDKDHKGVPKLNTKKPGENGSHPLHWPFHDRNINYRWDTKDGKTSYVELVGNQLSWYLGTACVAIALVLIAQHRLLRKPIPTHGHTYSLIETFTGLYVLFMLMNLWLISQRVMYLYHYFLGLMISYVLIALVWQYACEANAALARHRIKIMSAVVAALFVSFMFFLPLSDHWPLSKTQCERRNIWISHIVACR